MSLSVCLTFLEYVLFFVPGPWSYDTRNQNSWAFFHLTGQDPPTRGSQSSTPDPQAQTKSDEPVKTSQLYASCISAKEQKFHQSHSYWMKLYPCDSRLLSVYMWPATYAHQLVFSKCEYGQTKAYTITMNYHTVRVRNDRFWNQAWNFTQVAFPKKCKNFMSGVRPKESMLRWLYFRKSAALNNLDGQVIISMPVICSLYIKYEMILSLDLVAEFWWH